jgi:hypothetical protein
MHLVGKVTKPFRLRSIIRRQIFALGLIGFLRYSLAEYHSEVEVRVHGRRLTVRNGTPDLGTAMSSRVGEFDPLRDYLSHECEGVIDDEGG